MAYKLKTPQEFEKYVEEYLSKEPIQIENAESIIKNYQSSKLSDLYKLFQSLEGKDIDGSLFNVLTQKIVSQHKLDYKLIFENMQHNTITQENINALVEIIKNKFQDYISNVDKLEPEEFYNIAIIVNKYYPSIVKKVFKDDLNSNIKIAQQIISNRILATIDHWEQHSTVEAEEELKDILGAFYIATENYYPNVKIYLPGRIKSTKSAVDNINKVAKNSLLSLRPSDISKGISVEDVDKQFSMEKANTDFSGITVVISDVEETLHLDKRDPNSKEIILLRKYRNDCIKFSHALENYLTDNEERDFSLKELLQMQIEILMKLRGLTYEECTMEYEKDNRSTSFSKLLDEKIKEYHKKEEDNETEALFALDEIFELLDELKKRVNDKYYARVSEILMPEIINTQIIAETLKLKVRFVKNVRKPNGFCATYYEIVTVDNKKIEMQVITKMRFKESKDGSSDHSKLPNKGIGILHFFEPSVQGYSQENYQKLLDLLSNTPISKKNTLYLTPDSELSAKDKRLKRKLKVAEENVKLKEHFSETHTMADGTIHKSEYDLEQYLPIFAEYVSPKLMSVGSHHTRFNKSIVAYSKKSLVSAFTEVLLKKDYTSCLAQILIDRLEQIVENDPNEVSRNGIIKRAEQRYYKATKENNRIRWDGALK